MAQHAEAYHKVMQALGYNEYEKRPVQSSSLASKRRRFPKKELAGLARTAHFFKEEHGYLPTIYAPPHDRVLPAR
ncbi:hypothetical protein SNOG_06029 [Parastagonospora nodorum SN15]|uniref:Uncharacterized protein n=1 Tax=Phaeosphaeria nodorum (strain SN15 / ATCC MYA-4574 / FGSC 10173) TaxID=321614 RepID=Q0UQD5_PHANO|nr:hypothetical protein SNOG_06029 [Parastagonospora nodorum SN15]EAT87093.1 hypothetical protein SNOG_06029 [Parastagonospora nodorum SN15]